MDNEIVIVYTVEYYEVDNEDFKTKLIIEIDFDKIENIHGKYQDVDSLIIEEIIEDANVSCSCSCNYGGRCCCVQYEYDILKREVKK